MGIDLVDKVEEQSEINLEWYYHSTHYKKEDYKDILSEGVKCNYLLNNSWSGRYNGPYYISLSKITVPDNVCFLNYICANNPSFIIEGITPIKCRQRQDYEKYINTKDERRTCNFVGEYQYYYFIKNNYIKGILYNLYSYIMQYKKGKKIYIERILEIIEILEELGMDLPIYDYSRREKTLAHTIDKEKIKYYSRDILY